MSLRYLRTLTAIAERGSFAGAAQSVNLTQSAVSMQMKALEQQLGVKLFDRTKRPPTLTPAARSIAARADEVLAAYERLLRGTEGPEEIAGHLRLGAVPSVMTGLLPPALVALRGRHPGVRVDLTMGLSADLVERLARGALDVAIVSELGATPPGFIWTPFVREPLVLIAPAQAPDARASELLAEYPFIRYSRQAWVGRLIDQVLKRRKLQVHESMSLDTLEAVTAMVSHGLGVAIVPLREGAQMLYPVRQVQLPPPRVYRVLGLLIPEDSNKMVLHDALLAELKTLAGSRRPRGAKGAAKPGRKKAPAAKRSRKAA
jgi:DNA-binding transcriptional LysR family regulator